MFDIEREAVFRARTHAAFAASPCVPPVQVRSVFIGLSAKWRYFSAGVRPAQGVESGSNKESMMILDIPEILILALTVLLFWLGGKNLFSRKR